MRFAFVVCVRWLSFLSTWWVWFGFVSFVNSVGMRGFVVVMCFGICLLGLWYCLILARVWVGVFV